MYENLLANIKAIICNSAAVAAQTDLDGAVIDMAQDEAYDGIFAFVLFGDVTATSVLNFSIRGSDLANGSSSQELITTGDATAGASDYDSKLMLLDLRGAGNRYLFTRVKRGTANAVVNGVFAFLYKGRKMPVTQNADVMKQAYDWIYSG